MIHRTLPARRAIFAACLMLFAGFMAGIVAPGQARAQQAFENLDRLDSMVAMSVGANRGEPGGPIAAIDRRLRLAACPQTPTVEATAMNYAVIACAPVGWKIRVPLAPGQMAAKAPVSGGFSQVAREAVVKKGDPVQLVAGTAEFSISRLMIADEDGAIGALIRVRQDAKATPVMARVESIGIVRMPGI